jgi:hypothetical protein
MAKHLPDYTSRIYDHAWWAEYQRVNPDIPIWVEQCRFWRGRVLTGKYAHWCADWDNLPVDETTPEWSTCTCWGPDIKKAPSEGRG